MNVGTNKHLDRLICNAYTSMKSAFKISSEGEKLWKFVSWDKKVHFMLPRAQTLYSIRPLVILVLGFVSSSLSHGWAQCATASHNMFAQRMDHSALHAWLPGSSWFASVYEIYTKLSSNNLPKYFWKRCSLTCSHTCDAVCLQWFVAKCKLCSVGQSVVLFRRTLPNISINMTTMFTGNSQK